MLQEQRGPHKFAAGILAAANKERHSSQDEAPWEPKGAEITPFLEIARQPVPRPKEGLEGKSSRAFLDCAGSHLEQGNLGGNQAQALLGDKAQVTSLTSSKRIQETSPPWGT